MGSKKKKRQKQKADAFTSQAAAAAYAKVHVRTIRRWIREGLLAKTSTGYLKAQLDTIKKAAAKSKSGGIRTTAYSVDEREKQRLLMAKKRAAARDITIPPVKNRRRRGACKNNAERFCRTYFPEIFYNPFVKNQKAIVSSVERLVKQGGLQAIAAERGGGKSSIVKAVTVWAICYGHAHYVVVLGANGPFAEGLLTDIKDFFEFSDILAEDFPEICIPVRALEGAAQRAGSQTVNGERSRLQWSGKEIVFPHVKNDKGKYSPASGSVITTRGIDAAIRGLVKGEKRPDFVISDDIETRESAASISQTAKRKATMQSDVLGLVGPGRRIGVVIVGTIINRGCIIDQITDRVKHPEWNGIRQKRLITKPKRADLWAEFIEIRKSAQEKGDPVGKAAHKFYLKNRVAMDAGAVVSNKHRYVKGLQSSAIENCYVDLADMGSDFFDSEYQNTPPLDSAGANVLAESSVNNKTNGIEKGLVPKGCDRLTCFVDVHDQRLFWAAIAWRQGAIGSIVDYGVEQVNSPMAGSVTKEEKALQVEIAIADALREFRRTKELSGFAVEGTGEVRHIDLCLIDSGYKPDAVFAICKENISGIWRPSRGDSGGRSGVYRPPGPTAKHVRKIGDGFHESFQLQSKIWVWVLNADKYKLQAQEGFKVASLDEQGSISLYGNQSHRAFAEHMCSEVWNVERRKFEVVSRNNHWLDCVAGNCAAAAMLGIRVMPQVRLTPKKSNRTGKRPVVSRRASGKRKIRTRY